MNTKNILLFSIVTTLLFASCVEGMENQSQKRKHVLLSFTTPHDKSFEKQLEELDEKEQCDITLTCTYWMLTEAWLKALLEKIYGNPPKLTSLKIGSTRYFNLFNVSWKKCKNLETLALNIAEFWRTAGSVKIFNRIIENNINLTCLTLDEIYDFPHEKEITWKVLTNLEKAKLTNTSLTEISVNAIIENNPNLTHLDLSWSKKVILKNVNWEKAKKLEELYLISINDDIDTTLKDIKIIQKKLPNLRIFLKN